MSTDKIISNIRIGKLYLSVSNLIASICFFIVYIALDSEWVLLPTFLTFAAAFGIFFYFKKIEKRYLQLLQKQNNSQNN